MDIINSTRDAVMFRSKGGDEYIVPITSILSITRKFTGTVVEYRVGDAIRAISSDLVFPDELVSKIFHIKMVVEYETKF